MDPYLPKTLRNGTYYGRLEEVTRRIAGKSLVYQLYYPFRTTHPSPCIISITRGARSLT
jgi:hypothetical protein